MKVTKDILASKILNFLNKRILVEEFANWAETAMIESNYEEKFFDEISEILSKIGVINVKGFELSIAFYLNSLIKLNFHTVFGLKPMHKKTEEFVYI